MKTYEDAVSAAIEQLRQGGDYTTATRYGAFLAIAHIYERDIDTVYRDAEKVQRAFDEESRRVHHAKVRAENEERRLANIEAGKKREPREPKQYRMDLKA